MSNKTRILLAIAGLSIPFILMGGEPLVITIPYEYLVIAKFAALAALILTLRHELPRLVARPMVDTQHWLADEPPALHEVVTALEQVEQRAYTGKTVRL